MRKLKFMVCIALSASISFFYSPAEGIAEPVDEPGKPDEETAKIRIMDKNTAAKEKFRYSDPKMLIPGNLDIDPEMLIPGNPYIDPGMLIDIITKQSETK